MTRASALAASALSGGLLVLATPAIAPAQSAGDFAGQPVARVASAAPGSLFGRVQDDKGSPVAGVIVSALGTTTTFAVSDRDGRFEFGTLAPGPYVLRAHLSGYVAPRAQMVQVLLRVQDVLAVEQHLAFGALARIQVVHPIEHAQQR